MYKLAMGLTSVGLDEHDEHWFTLRRILFPRLIETEAKHS
jgi:hypothetical protein